MVFVAVHVGAGCHPRRLEQAYTALCTQACKKGIRDLKHGAAVADVCADVCAMLEDSPLTNAGRGSNLNVHGRIECDASIMDTRTGRGAAVGAVYGVRSPVRLALRVLTASFDQLSHGRIAPTNIVGDGAYEFATTHGVETCTNEDLQTAESVARFERWSGIVNGNGRPIGGAETDADADAVTDTVGVVCVDADGHVAVASSSGGVALKQPGRTGPAAMLGSGTWATADHGRATAVCCSGTGEDIINGCLGSRAAAALADSDDVLAEAGAFLRTEAARPGLQAHPAALGFMFVQQQPRSRGRTVELAFAHTTESMCVGYMAGGDRTATVTMSRNSAPGEPVAAG
ncbi:nucleophile aminohydrolase, partial [Dipodascopsis tothii]|uniref:nucleophile aminohydrolase n=1 Tax=Dipodascopsis tothii TaxID=44089 RepID=UPI0034CE9A43